VHTKLQWFKSFLYQYFCKCDNNIHPWSFSQMAGSMVSGVQLKVSLARRQPVIQPINDAASAATWSTIGTCKVETFYFYYLCLHYNLHCSVQYWNDKNLSTLLPQEAEHNIMLDHCMHLCDTKLYLECQDMEITLTGILLRSIPTWTDPFLSKNKGYWMFWHCRAGSQIFYLV